MDILQVGEIVIEVFLVGAKAEKVVV